MKQMKKTYIVPQTKVVKLGLNDNVLDVEIDGRVPASGIIGGIGTGTDPGTGNWVKGERGPTFEPLSTNLWEDDW